MYHLLFDEVSIDQFIIADADWDDVCIFNQTYMQTTRCTLFGRPMQ